MSRPRLTHPSGILGLMTLVILLGGARTAAALDVYVSPTGKVGNPGTLTQPLPSFEAARDWVRRNKGSVQTTVHFRAGTYPLPGSMTLTAEDSGTESAPVVYRAYGDEVVRFVGGRALGKDDARPVSDPAILARLDPAARGKVVAFDLARLGVRHCERPKDLYEGTGGLFEVYCNNRRMPIARWPNDGYTAMKEVLDGGVVGPNAHGGVFVYRGERPARWQAAVPEGLWVAGFWRVPWVLQAIRVQSIDVSRHTITHAVGVPQGIGSKYTPEVQGTRRGDGKEPWYVTNVLEEIDQPGEWCIHFPTRTLFFWPPDDLAQATILLADHDQPLLALNGVANVTIQGLTFEAALGTAVKVEGGEKVRVAGCTVRNSGRGIDIASGKAHTVESCDLYDIGAEGLRLAGGDRIRLLPAGHVAKNNHIHHCGRTFRTATAVLVEGVGQRFTRNLLHDLTYSGVRYSGNDHWFEGNEIHNIGLDGGDLGAFYSTLDWPARGSTVRGNFIHHAPNANAVYMDDGHSGDHILSNLVYQSGCGPFIGGGHDHEVRGNLVIQSEKGLHFDDRGIARRYNMSSKTHVSILPKINHREPPYATRYPELAAMLSKPELLEFPTGNRIEQNAIVACKKPFDLHSGPLSQPHMKLGFNLELSNDPGLIDPQSLELRSEAVADLIRRVPGFEPISTASMGLYVDAYRRRLPTAEETDRTRCRPPRRMFDSNVDMERSNQ